jgi:hypothetical protein
MDFRLTACAVDGEALRDKFLAAPEHEGRRKRLILNYL